MYVVSLNTDTRIHTEEQFQPFCRDTVIHPTFTSVTTTNCTGGPTQIKVDSFLTTPNLTLAQASATQVNTFPGDSFMVFRNTFVHIEGMVPYVLYEEYSHGFFSNQNSGHLLVSVKNKRYALRLNHPNIRFKDYPGLPGIEDIIKIDP
jgi:hypothetical protein